MQKTLIVDLDRCMGCHSCEVACKQENDVPLGCYWNKVKQIGPRGKYPDLQMHFLPVMCQQCSRPDCVRVCPTKASYIDEENIVLVNKEKCLGCRYCIMACPYEARSFNEEQKVVEKCTLCVHLLAIGEKPACVKNCVGSARFFGDLDDPDSDAAKALKKAGSDSVHKMPDVGNHPTVRYIMHRKTAVWRES